MTTKTVFRACALWLLSCAAAYAGDTPALQNVITYTHYAQGYCGWEQIPMFMGDKARWYQPTPPGGNQMAVGNPMPAKDLWVLSAWLEVEFYGVAPYSMDSWAMSGIANGIGGDYLVPYFNVDANQYGQGHRTEKSTPFPPGYGMKLVYGDIASLHVDMHVWCSPASYSTGSWFARLSIATVPVQP